jgi:hypothetical protein
MHLLVGQVAVLSSDFARERHAPGRVEADPSIPNSGREDRGQDPMGPEQ